MASTCRAASTQTESRVSRRERREQRGSAPLGSSERAEAPRGDTGAAPAGWWAGAPAPSPPGPGCPRRHRPCPPAAAAAAAAAAWPGPWWCCRGGPPRRPARRAPPSRPPGRTPRSAAAPPALPGTPLRTRNGQREQRWCAAEHTRAGGQCVCVCWCLALCTPDVRGPLAGCSPRCRRASSACAACCCACTALRTTLLLMRPWEASSSCCAASVDACLSRRCAAATRQSTPCRQGGGSASGGVAKIDGRRGTPASACRHAHALQLLTWSAIVLRSPKSSYSSKSSNTAVSTSSSCTGAARCPREVSTRLHACPCSPPQARGRAIEALTSPALLDADATTPLR